MGRVVITEHRPLRGFLIVVVAILLSGGAVAAYFVVDRLETRAALGSATTETDLLREEIAHLQGAHQETERELVNLRRTRQVEAQAYEKVEGHLTELQDRILGLEEEVAFYRGIVSSTGRKGVNVQRLLLFPTADPARYRFEVVLTRNMKSARVQKGTLVLSVAGEQGGESRKLSSPDLFGSPDSALEFSFRYFQRLEGLINLPPEFVPRRVHVMVRAPGAVPAKTERAFDWVTTTG